MNNGKLIYAFVGKDWPHGHDVVCELYRLRKRECRLIVSNCGAIIEDIVEGPAMVVHYFMHLYGF